MTENAAMIKIQQFCLFGYYTTTLAEQKCLLFIILIFLPFLNSLQE